MTTSSVFEARRLLQARRLHPGLAGLILVAGLLAAHSTALAATFTVTSIAEEGDADGLDGDCATDLGVCTWLAAQGEVNGSIHTSIVILFAPGLTAVPSGQFTGGVGMDLTIQGPVKIDMDLPPRRLRGLHIVDIPSLTIENVWITGNGTIGNFDNTETALWWDVALPGSCTLTGNFITGVHTPFRLGSPSLDMPCTVTDNSIGFDRAGQAVGNERGLVIYSNASEITGNTIAGVQGGFAIELWGDGNDFKNNRLGTDSTGATSFPNALGAFVEGDGNNVESNVLSNSGGRGIAVRGDFNDLYANRVGTDVAGTADLGNASHGIFVQGDDNCIGNRRPPGGFTCGPTPDLELPSDSNVVSGNGGDGIYVASGTRNVLLRNTVGTDVSGTSRVPNDGHGVFVSSTATDTEIQGGIVSGNSGDGIHVERSEALEIHGVRIGAPLSGSNPVGNQGHGIYAFRAFDVGIGTYDTGKLANVVSGNAKNGIHLEGDSTSSTSFVVIDGNFIGLDAANQPQPNEHGIAIVDTVSDIEIVDNVISGNRGFGIEIGSPTGSGTGPSDIVVIGNRIGTTLSPPGPTPAGLPNAKGGIHTVASSTSRPRQPDGIDIGLSSSFLELVDGNVISGNAGPGVFIEHGVDVSLQANFIGVDENMTVLPNQGKAGVWIGKNAGRVVVGRTDQLAQRVGNIISANRGHGLLVSGSSTHIVSNRIGTDLSGNTQRPGGESLGLGNGGSGIKALRAGILLIGENEQSVNVISANRLGGVSLAQTAQAIIGFNWIGSIGSPDGNRLHGISLGADSHGNSIVSNVVRGNLGFGVRVGGPGAHRNLISSNAIFANSRSGIWLLHGSNQGIQPPVTSTLSLSNVSGTTCPGCVVQVFSDAGEQGETLEVSTTADGNGNFSAAGPFAGPFVTCTTFDELDNTSRFGCEAGDVDLLAGLDITKRVTDLNGDDVEAGDRLSYRVDIANGTLHSFEDLASVDEVVDAIPLGARYVPESLTVDAIPGGDDLADGIGFDPAENAILWNGDLPADAELAIEFQVDVDSDALDGTEVENQAALVVAAATLAPPALALASDDPRTLALEDPTIVIVGEPAPEPSAALLHAAALATLAAMRRRRRPN